MVFIVHQRQPDESASRSKLRDQLKRLAPRVSGVRFVSSLIAVSLAGSLAWAGGDPPVRKPEPEKIRKLITDQLRAAVIPKVDFNGATLREAIEFYKKKTIDYGAPTNLV